MPIQPSSTVPTLLGTILLVFGFLSFAVGFGIHRWLKRILVGPYPFDHPYPVIVAQRVVPALLVRQLVSHKWVADRYIHSCWLAFDLSNSDHLVPFIDRLRVIIVIQVVIILQYLTKYAI